MGSATRAMPSPRPPSHRETTQPVAGSPSLGPWGSCSIGISRIIATQARNERTGSGCREISAAAYPSRTITSSREPSAGTMPRLHSARQEPIRRTRPEPATTGR